MEKEHPEKNRIVEGPRPLKKWALPVLEMIGETEDLKVGLASVNDGPSLDTGAS